MRFGRMAGAGTIGMAGAGLLGATIVDRIPAPPDWPWPERTRDVVNHWSDAFNFLDLIPGPPFLFLFILYSAAVVALCWFGRNFALRKLDGGMVSADGRLPFSLKPSFHDVAYLRDGQKGMLVAASCNLVRMGIISGLFNKLPDSYTPKALRGTSRQLTELEQSIVDAVESDVAAEALKDAAVVREQLERAVATAKSKLDALGLRPTATTRMFTALTVVLALFLIDGLALVRIVRSTMRGYHNIGLLVMLAFVATVVSILALSRVRYSGAGARFLSRLRADASDVIRRVQAMTRPGDNADVMYAMAATGLAACHGTIYNEVYQRMFPEPVRSSWNSSDSCSSCSGGSCGGGGCGGGGCGGGGCGGGGCGGG